MSNDRLVIAVLAATNREQRKSHHAAEWVAQRGREIDGVEIVYVDPREFYFPGDGEDPEGKDARYTDITARADAFLIVTPEYNHSYPGTLKRMLDSEFKNYLHKAVAVCGASDGNWGGTRAVESLLPVLRTMGLAISKNSTYFTHVDKLFSVEGVMDASQQERYEKSIAGVYEDLMWLGHAMKIARNLHE